MNRRILPLAPVALSLVVASVTVSLSLQSCFSPGTNEGGGEGEEGEVVGSGGVGTGGQPGVEQSGGVRGSGGRGENEGAGGLGGKGGEGVGGNSGGITGGAGGLVAGGTGGSFIQGGTGGNEGTAGAAGGDAGGTKDPMTGKVLDSAFLKVQAIFKKSCALSECHVNGPDCPMGVPKVAGQVGDCADQNLAGKVMGLDLSNASAIEATAINKPTSLSAGPSNGVCWKYLTEVEPKMTVQNGYRPLRIIPGDPKNSYIVMKLRQVTAEYMKKDIADIDVIRGRNSDVTRCHGLLMPARESLKDGTELSKQEVETIRSWIRDGARLWID